MTSFLFPRIQPQSKLENILDVLDHSFVKYFRIYKDIP